MPAVAKLTPRGVAVVEVEGEPPGMLQAYVLGHYSAVLPNVTISPGQMTRLVLVMVATGARPVITTTPVSVRATVPAALLTLSITLWRPGVL